MTIPKSKSGFVAPTPASVLKVVTSQRVLGAIAWNTAGSGVGQAVTFVANILIARALGAAGFGLYATILSTVNLFVALGTAGLTLTTAKLVAEHRTANPAKAARLVKSSLRVSQQAGLIAMLVQVGLSWWLCRNVLAAPSVVLELQVAAIGMFAAILNSAQMGVLQGLETFKVQAGLLITRGMLIGVSTFVSAHLWGLRGAVYANSASSVVVCLLSSMAVTTACERAGLPRVQKTTLEDVRRVLSLAFPVLVATAGFTPFAWWANALLARKAGYSQVGVFNIALQWQMITLFISSSASNVGLPLLASVVRSRDMHLYARNLLVSIAIAVVPTACIASMLLFFAPQVVGFYGHAPAETVTCLRMVAITSIVSALLIPVGHLIWTLDQTVAGMAFAFVRGLLLVGFSYLLVSRGAIGLTLAYLYTAAVVALLCIPYVYRVLRNHHSEWSTPMVDVMEL